MSDVRERLRRLLLLVPLVRARPGIPVGELACELGITRQALLEELDLLTMVGRPPFQPDDYIDLHVENDRVYVHLDQRFSKPPRLTPAEAAALYSAAALFSPAPEDVLSRALGRLEAILPEETRKRVAEIGRAVDAGSFAPSELGPLTSAISARREVSFDYLSQGRGTAARRRVQPHALFGHRGQWYLSGHCLDRDEERLFRVDRMSHLTVTEQTFPAPAGRPDRPGVVPPPREGQQEVRVRFSPLAAPYVRERFGEAARPVTGGGVEVLLRGESERWLTQWVLSFGGEAEVLHPPALRRTVAEAAEASLQS